MAPCNCYNVVLTSGIVLWGGPSFARSLSSLPVVCDFPILENRIEALFLLSLSGPFCTIGVDSQIFSLV